MLTQSHKFSVRPLTKENFEWALFTACTKMILEEVKRPELLNYGQIGKIMKTMIKDGTAFVCYKGETPVGAIGGLLLPNPYNPSILSLVEMMWYVLPKYRNTRAGYMLIKAFMDAGEEEGAYDTTLSLLASSEINIPSLEKKGFKFEEKALRRINKG